MSNRQQTMLDGVPPDILRWHLAPLIGDLCPLAHARQECPVVDAAPTDEARARAEATARAAVAEALAAQAAGDHTVVERLASSIRLDLVDGIAQQQGAEPVTTELTAAEAEAVYRNLWTLSSKSSRVKTKAKPPPLSSNNARLIMLAQNTILER